VVSGFGLPDKWPSGCSEEAPELYTEQVRSVSRFTAPPDRAPVAGEFSERAALPSCRTSETLWLPTL